MVKVVLLSIYSMIVGLLGEFKVVGTYNTAVIDPSNKCVFMKSTGRSQVLLVFQVFSWKMLHVDN